MGSMFESLGITGDMVAVLVLVLLVLQIIWIFMFVHNKMQYNRLKAMYSSFMRGNDGKSLDDQIASRMGEIEKIEAMARKNHDDIQKIMGRMRTQYRKMGIVKYNAFEGVDDLKSFVLVMLDDNNSGWILNSMQTRENCYHLLKDIIQGESFQELSNEEKEALEKAIYQA